MPEKKTPTGSRALTDRRLRLGLSQKRVADLAGIDQATVSRAEHGRGTDDIMDLVDRVLTTAERRRDLVDRAEADAFWTEARTLPEAGRLIGRIAAVARILLTGTLADIELAHRLLDCLPEDARRAGQDAAEP